MSRAARAVVVGQDRPAGVSRAPVTGPGDNDHRVWSACGPRPAAAGGGAGRGAGAGHVRQCGHRVHGRPGGHRSDRPGPVDGGRPAVGCPGRGEPAVDRALGVPPPVWAAVRGRVLHHGAARDDPGDPPLPGIGVDQGHRTGDGRADGRPFRGRHPGRHRPGPAAAGRGPRAGPETHGPDRRGVGGAEGDQGGDGVPGRGGGVHLAGGADLQEVHRHRDRGGPHRALPAGLRRVGHRVQDRRHDRRRGRDPARQPATDQGRVAVHVVPGRRRRALLPARAHPDRRRDHDPGRARGPGRPRPGRAGHRAGAGPRSRRPPRRRRGGGAGGVPGAVPPGKTSPPASSRPSTWR